MKQNNRFYLDLSRGWLVLTDIAHPPVFNNRFLGRLDFFEGVILEMSPIGTIHFCEPFIIDELLLSYEAMATIAIGRSVMINGPDWTSTL